MRVQIACVALYLHACGGVPPKCVTRCGLLVQTESFCAQAQAAEDKVLAAYSTSAVEATNPEFARACANISGYEVTWHDEDTFEMAGMTALRGYTQCDDVKTIDFTTNASFAHELAHAVQGCHAHGEVTPGLPADHPGWLPIYSAYSKIKW